MMRLNKNQKNILIGGLCAFILVMGIAYATFASQLNIKGTSNITNNWKIVITDVQEANAIEATHVSKSFSGLTANFAANLTLPGKSSIEYNIKVENQGDLDARLDKITLNKSDNPAIKFTRSGLKEGTILPKGENAVITIKVAYQDITEQPSTLQGTASVDLTFVQDDGEEHNPTFTPPTIDNVQTEPTTNAITVAATATDEETEITKYEFKLYGEEGTIDESLLQQTTPTPTLAIDINDPKVVSTDWIDNGTNNTYTFTGLKAGKDYVVKVRTTNDDGATTEEQVEASTQKPNIPSPTFNETPLENSTSVLITYPEGCGSKYTCTYQKNSETAQTVNTTTTNVEFTETGTLTATVSDGKDEVVEEYKAEVFKLSLSATPGTSKIIVTANPSAGSEVSTYEFSQDGSTYTDNGTNNVYTFTGLTHNTEYTLYVKGTTKSGKTKTAQITTSTTEIGTPTYSEVDTEDGKTITITYPSGCTDYTCEYSTDEGATWTNVTSNTVEVPFTESGTLVARVTDKGNTSNIVTASSYTIEINKILSGPTLAKLGQSVVTTGDGLYADSTETGRYIYKGSNPNNYITFNNETYRIISVETDGTLKIIKNESIGTMPFDPGYETYIYGVKNSNSTVRTRYTSTKTDYCYPWYGTTSNLIGCNVWGSSTTMLDASGNNITSMPRQIGGTAYNLPDNEAYINVYLNGGTYQNKIITGWYNTLSDTSKSKIEEHIFNAGIVKKQEGQTLEQDLAQESAYKWKGKIGLMNITDYVKANSNTSLCKSVLDSTQYTCSSTTWLFNSSYNQSTMSSYPDDERTPFLWEIGSSGIVHSIAQDWLDIRPSMYLSSDINISGDGTSSNPFTIS